MWHYGGQKQLFFKAQTLPWHVSTQPMCVNILDDRKHTRVTLNIPSEDK